MYLPLYGAAVIGISGALGIISLICVAPLKISLFFKYGSKLEACPHNPCTKINVAVCDPGAATTTKNERKNVSYHFFPDISLPNKLTGI